MDTLIESVGCDDPDFEQLIAILKKEGKTTINALIEFDRIYSQSDPDTEHSFETEVFSKTLDENIDQGVSSITDKMTRYFLKGIVSQLRGGRMERLKYFKKGAHLEIKRNLRCELGVVGNSLRKIVTIIHGNFEYFNGECNDLDENTVLYYDLKGGHATDEIVEEYIQIAIYELFEANLKLKRKIKKLKKDLKYKPGEDGYKQCLEDFNRLQQLMTSK